MTYTGLFFDKYLGNFWSMYIYEHVKTELLWKTVYEVDIINSEKFKHMV